MRRLLSRLAIVPGQAQIRVTMPSGRPTLGLRIKRMTHKVKDLSPDQRMAIESLLGRSIAENEEISILTSSSPSAPEWLQASWESAKEQGLDQLSVAEIEEEIAAARKARRESRPSEQ
jgi:hypothetical protein